MPFQGRLISSSLIITVHLCFQVKDALTNKLVGYQTPVALNPHTGELRLADTQSQLLLPLIRIPEVIDWLSDVELNMAKEAKPEESGEGIAQQIANLQVRFTGAIIKFSAMLLQGMTNSVRFGWNLGCNHLVLLGWSTIEYSTRLILWGMTTPIIFSCLASLYVVTEY